MDASLIVKDDLERIIIVDENSTDYVYDDINFLSYSTQNVFQLLPKKQF